jgi:hypothetical protein
MEIAVTVPYEIKIDAEGINLDTFDCFFTIYKDSVSYAINLEKKEDVYILKIPKELAFLGGGELKYEVNVRKENAIFVASEGEMTVLGMDPSKFTVDIKPQEVKKKTSKTKNEKKEDSPKATSETSTKPTPTPAAKEDAKPKKTEVKEENTNNFFNSISERGKFSFLNNISEKKVVEQEDPNDPNDPNVKLRKIIQEMKSGSSK